ncbi:hypothetical protein BS47DRAFT_863735 [Hydnum rufescens UP504]|uniref:Uncharacterized protein n=1 Tax=Hydnum rufescens UP504 TaxID=1448309 RepID=A0A9P6AZJ2_9AGAM|nr:hypothetical protein BS47DRAFT_863735 [Hydnum rufescens UP504]
MDTSSSSPSPSSAPSHILQAQVSEHIPHSMPNANGIEAFLARAELAKLTRALRARLSYASYKAAHNLSHVPLHTLEHRQPPSPMPNRTIYQEHRPNHPPTGRDPVPLSQGFKRRQNQNQMMPPPAAPSLYSALLGNTPAPGDGSITPSNKRVRHALSADASPKASTSTTPRVSSPTPRSGTRRKKPRTASPSSRSITSTLSARTTDVEMRDGTTELEDMTAAAALTSLLHNTTNSSGSGASGPHSPTLSHTSSFESESFSRAPVSSSRGSMGNGVLSPSPQISGRGTTPKPAVDADAAELMLFLATSPSPARANIRRPERTASGKNAGRVLFPASSQGSASSAEESEHVGGGNTRGKYAPGDSRITRSSSQRSDTVLYRGASAGKLKSSTGDPIIPGELLPPPPSPTLTATVYSQSQNSEELREAMDSETTLLEQAFVPSKIERPASQPSPPPSPLNLAAAPCRAKDLPSGSTSPNPSFCDSQGSSGACGGRRQPPFSFTEYLNVSPSSPLRASTIPTNMGGSPYSHPHGGAGLSEGTVSATTVGRRLFEDDPPSPPRLNGSGVGTSARLMRSGGRSSGSVHDSAGGDLVGASA